MNYPVWYLPTIGGGTLIALIAISHVFVSHFAVGGGLLLPLLEYKARKRKDAGLLAFTKRFARFFVLLTLVYGSLTGVGIWLVISLVQPGGTSLLIHQFVFAWAAEWVFFLVEIVAISVYLYCFDSMKPAVHQAVGWIYFGASWCSLFIINGIITFMLTAGNWPSDGSFWSVFFNPGFWPSLTFRSLVAIILAGLFALMFSSFCSHQKLRIWLTRCSCGLVLSALLIAIPAARWYLSSLSPAAADLVGGASPTILRALHWGAAGAILLCMILVFGLWQPARCNRAFAGLALAAALMLMGSFEWTREAARRPFVVQQALFSNGISASQLPRLQQQGFLPLARWSAIDRVKNDPAKAGRELFKLQCHACHTLDGINNDLRQRTQAMSQEALAGYLTSLHQVRYFMPPFAGNDNERLALAAFLTGGLFRPPQPPVQGQPKVESRQLLFEQNCTLCHTTDLVRQRTAGWSRIRIRQALDNLNQLNPAMPDYRGTAAEKELLTDYIHDLNEPEPKLPQKGGER